MNRNHLPCATSRLHLVASIAFWPLIALAMLAAPNRCHAHEGHAALPTKGLTVQGDDLLLSEGARAAIDLQTEKVVMADMPRVVPCNARVELPWQQQAMVTTQVPGRIGRVLVRPGDLVKAGQELANIESLELESLQLAMLQADAELLLAQEQLTRQSSLAEQGVIAGKAALETQSTLQQKNAELEIAMCKLRALGLAPKLLEQVRQSGKPVTTFAIVSPISGIVAEADVRIGRVVETTEHLFHIVDLSTLWVLGDVLESEVSKVQVGQPTQIRFKAFPEQRFSGVIDHLHLKMDEKRLTRAVVVVLDNSAGLLRPGMFGQMEVEVGRSKEAILCPTEGVIRLLGEEYVLLNRGEGKYIRRQVRVGIRSSHHVEILDGLFPGDQIVVNGNHVLFSLFANESSKKPPPQGANLSATEEVPPINSMVESRSDSAKDGFIVVRGSVELPTDRKAFASSRIEGRIARILVRHSQPVQAGQVLAEVESLELRNLQGMLLESQSKLDWTSERVRRLESFAQQSITSKKELWQLQTDQRMLTNKVASTARKLAMVGVPEAEIRRVLQTDLSAADCDLTLVRSVPIYAAIDGAVAAFDVVPGQIVGAQDTLFEIHNTSAVWVKGFVFQQDASHVQIGQKVEVTFHALPGVTVRGTIVRVSPVLSSTERVLPLWVEVDNPDGRLIEGMLASMKIETGSSSLTVNELSLNSP